MDNQYLLKYNFLDECKDYLRVLKFNGFDDLEDSKYEHMFVRAMERIQTAVNNKVYRHSDNISYEIISFIIAVKIIHATNNKRLLKRFVLYESMVIEQALQEDINNDMIRDKLVSKFSNNLIIKRDGIHYKIGVSDYLTMMNQFNEPEWRLINQTVGGGFVYIKKNKLVRLLRIGIMKYLEKRIINDSGQLPPIFNKYIDTARSLLDDFEKVELSKSYPPCMNHILEQIKDGKNPNNISRVILVTYLLNRGISVEEVANTFNNTPDHDDKKTEYYISKLKGYKSYGCSKIESYGLCFRNEKCGNIINPMHFKD
jgi:DNA primase large subunit